MHERTTELIRLMDQNHLTVADVAEMTQRSENTVRIWRSRHGGRIVPAQTLRLIEAELELRANRKQP